MNKQIVLIAGLFLLILSSLGGCGDTVKIADVRVEPGAGSLILTGRKLSKSDLKKLSGQTELKELSLEHTNITDLSCLSGMAKL